MNVLITGAAGFIGSHATDFFLKEDYNVIGVDNFTYAGNKKNLFNALKSDKFKLYEYDICETEKIRNICVDNNIEWILNFAAETHVDNSIVNSDKFIKSNILGVKSLLEVCRKINIKFFQISTDEVYGSTESGIFFENNKLDPKNPYSATKASAEHYVKAYNNTYGVEYLIVRPTNNIGERQNQEKFFPTILNCINSGIKIPIYDKGYQIREWLYVKDNVRAIEYILRNSELNEVYNIGSNNETKNIDFVEKICSIKNISLAKSVEFVKDRPGHDFRYSVSNKKLAKLGFDDYMTLDEILYELVPKTGV